MFLLLNSPFAKTFDIHSSRLYYTIGSAALISYGIYKMFLVRKAKREYEATAFVDITSVLHVMVRPILGGCSTVMLRKIFDTVDACANVVFPCVFPKFSINVTTCQNNTKTKLHWISYGAAKNCKDVILYLHGGAWITRDSADKAISKCLLPKLATYKSSVQICSVQYELATTSIATIRRVHEEIASVYLELMSEGYRVVSIMGDSAGGNLSVGVMLTLLDIGKTQQRNIPPPLSLILLSPCCDMRTTANSFTRNLSNDFLHMNFVVNGVNCFIGRCVDKLHDPYVSFNFNTDDTLKNLPPILMIGGTYELLYDDMATFAKRITDVNASPNAMEFVSGQECSHNYMMFDLPLDYVFALQEARLAQDRIASFIMERLAVL